jgi:hypothetical protein
MLYDNSAAHQVQGEESAIAAFGASRFAGDLIAKSRWRHEPAERTLDQFGKF